MPSRRARPLAVILLLLLFPGAATAQMQGSVGLGVGTVRYTGGSSFSTATISPAAQFVAQSLYASAGAWLSSLPGGEWATQERAEVWAATQEGGRVRFALAGTGGATTRTDGSWASSAHGIAEVLWSARGGAAGVAAGAGPSWGAVEGESAITAPHVRVRAWWSDRPLLYTVSVEPTRFLGGWFTDVSLGTTFERGRVVAGVWTVARLSATWGSSATASASVQAFVAPRVALEVTGGGYLRDPYQGFPRAGFLTAGVRVHAVARPVGRAAVPNLGPLVPERRGDSVVVRFRMPGATSVAIAGDWNAWQPVALEQAGADDEWMGTLALGPGTYHFSLLVGGTEWVVPGGVAIVPDGFGGQVAVLTVP